MDHNPNRRVKTRTLLQENRGGRFGSESWHQKKRERKKEKRIKKENRGSKAL